MATQKPISTISYNSETFLKEKLDTWVEQHLIQAYMYICHKGEDGDKDHIHLRIEPNKKLDPMSLTELLREYEMGKEKPLGVRPWRNSKEEDWILYAVHDAEYLNLKYGGGEKGEKLPYDWKDIKVSQFYDLETAWIRAKAAMKHNSVNIAKRLQKGEKASELVMLGESPFMVSTIARVMAQNDYQRLAERLSDTNEQMSLLLSAIDRAGLRVELDTNGIPYLVPALRDWTPAAFIPPAVGPRPMPEKNDDADELLDLLRPENFNDKR